MKRSPSYKYALGRLKRNLRAGYSSIASGAAKRGLPMFPIVYGRALVEARKGKSR